MTTCRLCKRECAPSSTLCQDHLAARKEVEAGHEIWSKAYGVITRKEYLERIQKSSETGQWAKEVAAMLSDESAG
jgi:hypothetical protein